MSALALRWYGGVDSDDQKEAEMAKEVTCPPCGEIIRGDDDAELIANVHQHVQDHGHETPPEMAGMTEEEINAQILSEAREVPA